MENKDSKKNDFIVNTNFQKSIDETIIKGNELLINSNESFHHISSTANSILNKSNEVVTSVNNLGSIFLESQKISSQTTLGLKKIEEDHKTINKSIDNEYNKQNQVLNTAANVVEDGLKNNDIDKIRLGLETMSVIANHNPMSDLKNALDKEINNNFDDDDFYIEI